MTPVRLEPAALRSRVKHSTTEPLRSLAHLFRILKSSKIEFHESASLLPQVLCLKDYISMYLGEYLLKL